MLDYKACEQKQIINDVSFSACILLFSCALCSSTTALRYTYGTGDFTLFFCKLHLAFYREKNKINSLPSLNPTKMSTRIKNHHELLSTETIITRCTVFIYEYFINSIGSNHNVVIHVSNNPIKLRFRQKPMPVMNIPLDLKCFCLSSTVLYIYIFYFNYTIFVLFRNP